MTPAELDAALKQAFLDCETTGCPLTLQQQELLRTVLQVRMTVAESEAAGTAAATSSEPVQPIANPLDELTPEQRQALLEFIQAQEQQNQLWKVQLLNDWLAGTSSGDVQFIREIYGVAWLERVQPVHLAKYAETTLKLKVGDRIEVCNALWEWVQEDGGDREWFPCTVIGLVEIGLVESEPETIPAKPSSETTTSNTSCTIRFDNGQEFEIQGVYEWNRYYWRWVSA